MFVERPIGDGSDNIIHSSLRRKHARYLASCTSTAALTLMWTAPCCSASCPALTRSQVFTFSRADWSVSMPCFARLPSHLFSWRLGFIPGHHGWTSSQDILSSFSCLVDFIPRHRHPTLLLIPSLNSYLHAPSCYVKQCIMRARCSSTVSCILFKHCITPCLMDLDHALHHGSCSSIIQLSCSSIAPCLVSCIMFKHHIICHVQALYHGS